MDIGDSIWRYGGAGTALLALASGWIAALVAIGRRRGQEDAETASHAERITAIEHTLESHAASCPHLPRLSAIDGRITRLEEGQSKLEAEATKIAVALASLPTRDDHNALQRRIDERFDRLVELLGNFRGLRARTRAE